MNHSFKISLLLSLMLASGSSQADAETLNALFENEENAGDVNEANDSKANLATDNDDIIELSETSETAAVSARPMMLEEIVVTAQKREQGLSDVPISMNAFTGDKISDAGIEDLVDLAEYSPNFKLVDGGFVPLIYMRGVGSGSNQGFEMSVGMYNDGIHFGRPFQTLAAFLDVERVEVLRGPQSILFGKNAIAGALNITSAKPENEWDSQVKLSWLEPNGDGEAAAYVTGGLFENLQGRLAVRTRTEGGYIYNITQQRDEIQLDEQALRGTLSWQPLDPLDLTLKIENSTRDQAGRTFQIIDRGILTESNQSHVGLDNIRATTGPESNAIETDNLTLTGRWDLNGHEFTSVTGLSDYSVTDRFEPDDSDVDSILVIGTERYRQFSQELRWASPIGERFDFIAGAFYQTSEQKYDEVSTLRLRTGTIAYVALPGNTIDIVGQAGPANLIEVASGDFDRVFRSDNDALSLFGQASWNFAMDWNLTTGLRVVTERKVGSRVANLYQVGTQDPADPVTVTAFERLLVESHSLSGKRRSNSVLPSFVLKHDLNDNTMLYGSWSRGAKSGGYDVRNNNAQDGPTGGRENFEYDDEIADAFELGGKFSLFDRAAELNAALFLVNYTDLQVSVFDGVAGFAVTNAGEARVQGLEIDGRWLATPNLSLNASLALLDFEWLEYDSGPCYFGSPDENEDGFCDLAGKENQQAPKWSGSLGASYFGELSNALNWSAGIDVNFRDSYFISGDLDPRGENPAYYKVNARLAMDSADGVWTVAVVGKNLTNEITTSIGASPALDTGGYAAVSERPRVYGVDLRYRFGGR